MTGERVQGRGGDTGGWRGDKGDGKGRKCRCRDETWVKRGQSAGEGAPVARVRPTKRRGQRVTGEGCR